MRRAVLLFVKHPEPGKVKTRLAATLGPAEAARIYERLVQAVCARLPAEPPIRVLFDPPQREAEVRQWIGQWLPATQTQFHAQAPGPLGARLEAAFSNAFAEGFERVAVIGSDCVEISPDLFSQTWTLLEETGGVLGPSADGGYYLLALKAPCPVLFENIEWSSERVLGQTLERARAAGLPITQLPMLRDVDCEADWRLAEPLLPPA